MPPDNTAVVPAAFLHQLRSMSQAPPPPEMDETLKPVGEITKQVSLDSIAQESNLVSTSPPVSPTSGALPAPPAPRPFAPPPFRPTDRGALARATAKAGAPSAPHRAPPPAPTGRKSLLPPVPSPESNAIPKPDDMPSVLKASRTTAPPPSAPLPSKPAVLANQNDEISALKAMLTPRPMPAFNLADAPVLELDEIELEPEIPPSTTPPEAPRPIADSVEAIDRYEGINPRFLRAAAKLEKAQVNKPAVETERKSEPDEEEWRRQLEESTAGSVISFLPPTTIENPAVVEGFPQNQRNRAPKGTMRPVSLSKPPPIPKRK
jgi:hypothetical protein